MAYSWNKEYYGKALKTMANTAGKKLVVFEELHNRCVIGGWMEWFRETYPDHYRKYADAVEQVVLLWGKKDGPSMETWKAAVKVEVDASQWAIDRYLEHHRNLIEEEKKRGTQEVLAL